MGFEVHESMETKKIHLRTHHGVDCEVKLYNSKSVTHFGCKNWEAFCKTYGFDEGMLVTMDLGDPETEQWTLGSLLIRLQFFPHVSLT